MEFRRVLFRSKTLHWPTSPGVQSDDKIHRDIDRLIGVPVSITEKMDGSNVTLCNGEVYARSTIVPSAHAWHGMVRKHHAWTTRDLEIGRASCRDRVCPDV